MAEIKASETTIQEKIQSGFDLLFEKHLPQAQEKFLSLQNSENQEIHNFALLGLAKIAMEEKRFDDAKALLAEIKEIVLDELKQEWLYTQGDLAFQTGDYQTSLQWLEKSKKGQDKNILLQAKAHLKNGDLPKAEKLLLSLGENNQKDAFILLGETAYGMGHYSEAARYLSKASDETAELKLFSSLINAGFFEKADELQINATPEALLIKAEKLAPEEGIALLQNKFPDHLEDKRLMAIGILESRRQNDDQGRKYFQMLIDTFPNSPLVPEALYLVGGQKNYQTLYEKFPLHPLASEAYFKYYTLQDYLLGSRQAIKHLHEFKIKFPNAPLLIYAYYLEGLDYLHDRRSLEGKWLCRQNLTAAIDAFQMVETLYNQQEEYSFLRYQAILERAKANLKIANAAKPAKKAIYLDYAKSVFQSLIEELNQNDHPLLEETLYHYALALDGQDKLKALNTLLDYEKKKGLTHGYYLASALYHKAQLTSDIALFDQSLIAASPSYLGNEEVLNIKIAKAEHYLERGDLDSAMLQLSEVVNANTASSSRLKAMFLRAKIYNEQGRKNLAQKQLEFIALKGGNWAVKAKEQLENLYD